MILNTTGFCSCRGGRTNQHLMTVIVLSFRSFSGGFRRYGRKIPGFVAARYCYECCTSEVDGRIITRQFPSKIKKMILLQNAGFAL